MSPRTDRALETAARWAWRVGAAAVKSGLVMLAILLVEPIARIVTGHVEPVPYLNIWFGGLLSLTCWPTRR